MDMDDKAVFGPCLDADGCLVVSFLMGPGGLDMHKALKIFLPRIRQAFPHVAIPEFKRVWAGKFTMTPDGIPRIFELDKNIYASTGCNGAGHTLAISAARETARLIIGTPKKDLNMPVSPYKTAPAASLVPWLLRQVIAPPLNRFGA